MTQKRHIRLNTANVVTAYSKYKQIQRDRENKRALRRKSTKVQSTKDKILTA